MPGETDIEVQNGVEAAQETQVHNDVQVTQEIPSEPKIEAKAEEVKAEIIAEVKAEIDAEVKTEIKAEEKVEEKVEEKADVAPEPIIQQNGTPKKVPMSTTLDTDAVRAAIDDVRSDSSKTQWAVFKFEGRRIVTSGTGAEFEKFREQFTEDDRAFGYIRIQTGDEMSKRQKFLFVTWVGSSVSVLQRAKMSTDKSLMKNMISNFAVELQLENASEINLQHFVDELNKAGGANYGTGIREI